VILVYLGGILEAFWAPTGEKNGIRKTAEKWSEKRRLLFCIFSLKSALTLPREIHLTCFRARGEVSPLPAGQTPWTSLDLGLG
jgi:hypothetical protein